MKEHAKGAPVVQITQSHTFHPAPLETERGEVANPLPWSLPRIFLAWHQCPASQQTGVSFEDRFLLQSLVTFLSWKPEKLFCLRNSEFKTLPSPFESGMFALKGGSQRAMGGGSISVTSHLDEQTQDLPSFSLIGISLP